MRSQVEAGEVSSSSGTQACVSGCCCSSGHRDTPEEKQGEARAVSVDAAKSLLGCGRSQIFQLLKSGALRRAPKVGKAVMITTASLEAFQERGSRAPLPPTKRRPARRTNGQGERDAILKLIRRA